MKKLFSILLAVVLIAMAIPATVSAAGTRTYTVTIHTGDTWDAGTDNDVYVELIGANGTTGEIELDSSGDDFEKNDTHTYTFSAADVGTVTKFIVSLGGGLFDEWYFGWIEFNGDRHYYNDYLDILIYNHASFFTETQKYNIELGTSNSADAGTKAAVKVQLIGETGTSKWLNFNTSGNDLIRGKSVLKKDEILEKIGKIKKTKVYCAVSSPQGMDDWNLEYIKIDGKKFKVNRLFSQKHTTMTLDVGYYGSALVTSVQTGVDPTNSASTFSSPDIWFVVSGGVLMLAVAAFAVIFVQRRKKKTMAVVESSDSAGV